MLALRPLYRMARRVVAELAKPDAQRRDWFGWASVQMAHMLIGVVPTAALVVAFGWPALIVAACVAAAYAAGKELPDLARVRTWAGLRDSIHDAGFVAAGGVFIGAALEGRAIMAWAVLVAAAAGLAAGVAARIQARIERAE
jgi:hypothetical protein